ncbi:uncharacterized protein [Blastocystis hominis]|uniref:Uncharacterized protein n=1 Tax=Blastocystis hominis TaxID=12968 RepID=D8M4C3_BLAHO|nr:uncharacterized protein [Blastocystis hominis]CBK22912.2 unnamed protein product [Blastocystis hominis]|eukprot:XP_012896960.1 uncharacterized protein [Blastocystis hominis]
MLPLHLSEIQISQQEISDIADAVKRNTTEIPQKGSTRSNQSRREKLIGIHPC